MELRAIRRLMEKQQQLQQLSKEADDLQKQLGLFSAERNKVSLCATLQLPNAKPYVIDNNKTIHGLKKTYIELNILS